MLQPEGIFRQEIVRRRRQFAGAATQFHQPMQQRAHRDAGAGMRLPHGVGESPQTCEVPIHGVLQRRRAVFFDAGIETGLAQELFVSLLEILDEFLFVGLRIVDQAAEFIEPPLAQPVEHDINRGALFAHEQDAPAPRDVVGDQVCDGLRFARARRALDDVAGAGPGARDGRSLGGVAGNHDMLVGKFEGRRCFLRRPSGR